MATANLAQKAPLSLEQLIALSEEIAALARAGMPLDQGLSALGHDLPGRLGRVAQEMGGQLTAGMPLDKVVAQAGGRFPAGYQALIEAGLRAGNLPGILQGIMQLARKTGDLRRQVVLATINPLLVIVITYVLFLFWLDKLAPVYLRISADWEIDVSRASAIVTAMQEWHWLWGSLLPLLMVGGLIWSWNRSASGTGEWSLVDIFSLGIVRGIGRMRRAGQYAGLCEQLAILLEHRLPLAESLQLISQTLTSRPLATATRVFAEQLQRGQTTRPPPPFPPLLACILLDGQGGRDLSVNLRQMAANYQDEVRRRGLWLGTWVPVLLTLCIGGVLTLFHALVTLGPWLLLMQRMAEP